MSPPGRKIYSEAKLLKSGNPNQLLLRIRFHRSNLVYVLEKMEQVGIEVDKGNVY